MRAPVHTAEWNLRFAGTPDAVDVGVHESVSGSYLPPVFIAVTGMVELPPHTIISVPVQTAVCPERGTGVLASIVIGVHVSVIGS
jgi:hypothetical protein